MPDYSDTEADSGNMGWETRRKFLLFNKRLKAEDPESGRLRFPIRLGDIFGFAIDYNCVLYGFTHTFTLIRNFDNKDKIPRMVPRTITSGCL